MAVPTVTLLTPAFGPSGGVNQIEIIGTGFNVPVVPSPGNGPSGPFVNTVDVKFGGALVPSVLVISDTRLIVHPPPSPLAGLAADNHGADPVDVEVFNLDGVTGLPIAGETVTVADGYEYRRPQLAHASGLLLLVAEVVLMFKRQVIANVSISTNTDYDSDTADLLNITDLAEFPGIAITGPDLLQNRFYSTNTREAVPGTNAGEFRTTREAYTVDVGFSLIGVSDHKIEMINMMNATQLLFRRNTELYLLRDPADPSLGTVKYEFQLTEGGDLKTIGVPNNSNVRAFGGSFLVRGFDIEGLDEFAGDFGGGASKTTNDAEVALDPADQLGATFRVGPGPGGTKC